MSEKGNKEIEIELEDLEKPAQIGKIGEVIYADTGPPYSVITLKIQHRPDSLRLGQPLVIETDNLIYYTLLNRLYFSARNSIAERFANSPFIDLLPPSQIEGVRGKEFYGLADLSCLRILPKKSLEEIEFQELIRGFDTIPPIFSTGREVTKEEIDLIYKTSEYSDSIGTLRGFEYEVPIDFAQLVKKPYGLFGRTGIGKSILNKIICLFILKHQISQLILFDMQGEYGLVSRADKTKGLAWYYREKIQIYRLGELDKKLTTIDGAEQFFIYKDSVTSGDIIASVQTLNEPSINVLMYIEGYIKNNPEEFKDLFDAIDKIDAGEHEQINPFSLGALRNRIIRFKRYDFLKERGESKREDSLENIFIRLLEGKSIVVDFGKYGINTHLYMFIANMITRRLYNMYSQKEDDTKLPPLIVVVEEAHKFLKSGVIQHTIFGRIAREMRKFQLTLAFVDQRPSQIDEEVYSQIANTFVMHMIDDKDIKRVVQTFPDSKRWRGIISGLQKKQCLIRGDAVAVPTIIEVFDYNDEKELKKKLGIGKPLAETLKALEKADLTKLEEN
jgi:hypothetical protein